jgi:uncharacterized membrane protein
MNDYSILEKENYELRNEHEKLFQISIKKVNYINELEKKISILENNFYKKKNEDQKKKELFDAVKNTKDNLGHLKQLYIQKFTQLQNKFIQLKVKIEQQNYNTENNNNYFLNTKINKYISKIDKVNIFHFKFNSLLKK